jgi:hypothetical protein
VAADPAEPVAVMEGYGMAAPETAAEYPLQTFVSKLAEVKADSAVGMIADEVLKLTARNEIQRRLRNERIARIEDEARARAKVVEELRADMSQRIDTLRAAMSEKEEAIAGLEGSLATKNRVIAGLQERLAEMERQCARVERESEFLRKQMSRFPAPLELLPLLRRSAIAREVDRAGVAVAATAEPGHFLYGPYIQLDPGNYRLELRCSVSRCGDETLPVLTIEIVAGGKVVAERSLTSRALIETVPVEFSIGPQPGDARDEVEFRVSHHGNADLLLAEAWLRVSTGALRGAGERRHAGRRQRVLLPRVFPQFGWAQSRAHR